ncbi:MAG: 4-(cytidine 5'-diphospho)-2-C-methyl-D-erythritol kinase [Lachnospiraceae bacterium]|nr:4-(cytidine 5'-diphospho)-2-C-methyl-D-erythritol kinase [Lachnospiraceae bacterium]
MKEINLRAYAKINLGLDVVGRLDNGYHLVSMIMQTIRLFDKLSISVSDEPGIRVTTNLDYLPTNENNLVYKAAKLMIDEFAIDKGVTIHLEKHIPVAAGLAGGSSDCAATLYGMNRLFRLNLSQQELMDRGVTLGADVPYCIMRGTALSEGIGEKLSRLKPMPDCYIVVAKPPVSVSTKYVYEHIDNEGVDEHPDIKGIIKGLEAGDLRAITERLANVLENVTINEHPEIASIKELMIKEGALNSLMSGSGPTVFGIFDDKDKADKANKAVYESGLAKRVYTVVPINAN